MSNPSILIIGNGLAATAAIEELRRQDVSSEITLFCPEGVRPYQRQLLPVFASREFKELQLAAVADKFFADQKVRLIVDDVLSRLSLKRKQLTTENKTHVPFDKLLLTDVPQVRLPEIKGNHKEGVFNVAQLPAVKALIKQIPFVDHIIVPVTNFAGLDMVCALSRLNKQVSILTPAPGILTGIFDDDTAGLLKQILEARNIRIIFDELESILGDAEVKAVRLQSGKIIAAEMVVFDNAVPDLRFLADSGLLENGKIPADGFFSTPLPEIFVCGSALGHYDLSAEESAAQGRCAAANLLNAKSCAYQAPLSLREFGRGVCDGFCGGQLRLLEGGREHMLFDGPSNVFKKVFLFNDCLVGAVWFNALKDKDKVRQALTKNMSLAGIEDQFLHSTTR